MGIRPAYILLCVLLTLSATVGHAAGDDVPLWTTQPTRIDRSKQTFERLPAVKVAKDDRIWLAVPSRIKVLDSTSFVIGDHTYQFEQLKPIKSKRLCRAIEGGRWACGRMAAIFLGNLVRGKRLLCDITQGVDKIALSHCVIGTRDVAEAIIVNGYGMADGDEGLLEAQSQAQADAKRGLWRNPECKANFDSC